MLPKSPGTMASCALATSGHAERGRDGGGQ
jgi:hypothetical protein